MAAAAPRRIEIVPWGFWKSESGAQTRNQGSSQFGGGWTQTNNNGNSVSWDVLIDSGTWAIDVIYSRQSSSGILDVSLGGSSVGTIDMYGVAGNVVGTISGIAVAAAGYYDLTAAVNGKNASSTGYRKYLELIVCRRTGA